MVVFPLCFGECFRCAVRAYDFDAHRGEYLNAGQRWAAHNGFGGLEHPGARCISMQCTLSLAYGIAMVEAKQRVCVVSLVVSPQIRSRGWRLHRYDNYSGTRAPRDDNT